MILLQSELVNMIR